MNKTVFWVVLLLLMFIAINLTYAQWISIGGPGGVGANKIITNGNSLFVSSFSGLFISTNDGLSWDTTIFSQKKYHSYRYMGYVCR